MLALWLVCCLGGNARADLLRWDGSNPSDPGDNGGNGTWNTTSANWWKLHSPPDRLPGVNVNWTNSLTDVAEFGWVSGTVTVGSGISVNRVGFISEGYVLSGASALTLAGPSPTIAIRTALAATIGNGTGIVLAGSAGLTKTGGGTITLNGSAMNTFTGGLNVNGGTLVLDFHHRPTGLLDAGNALGFGGGTLMLRGKGGGIATTQALGNVTVNAGGGNLLIDPNGGNSTTLSLGTLTAMAAGGSLTVGKATGSGSGTVTITTTSNKDAATGIYCGRIVFASGTAAGYDWATTTSSGPNYTLSGYNGYTTLPTSGGGSTINYKMTAATALDASVSVNTLKLENPSGDLALGSNTLTVSGGGILVTGTTARQITATAGATRLTAGDGSGSYDLIVHQHSSGGLTIGATIGDNGANAVKLVKTGSGTLTLSADNTYSGGTTISGGVLSITSTSALPGWNTAGAYSVGSGATLAVHNAVSDASIATMVATGNFSSGAVVGFDTTSGDRTYTGIFGSYQAEIGLTKVGSNTLILDRPVSDPHTFIGATTVAAGTLQLNSADAIRYSPMIIVGDVAGNAPATLRLSQPVAGDAVTRPLTIRAGSSGTKSIESTNTSGVMTVTRYVLLDTDVSASSAGGTGVLEFYGEVIRRAGGQLNVTGGTVQLSGGGDNNGLSATVHNGATLILNKASVPWGVNAIKGDVTINAGGTLKLAGTGGDQIVDFGTVTNNGTLDMNGRSESLTALNGSGTITNTAPAPGTLTIGGRDGFHSAISGVIQDGAGTVALVKIGVGTTPNIFLTLSGANTYSGGTVWGTPGGSAAGVIVIGSSSIGGPGSISSGPFGTGTFTVRNNGAASNSSIRSTDSTARTISNPIVFDGTNIKLNTSGSGDLIFDGPVNLGTATRTVTVANANTTLSGQIAATSGALTKEGSGTLILSGNNLYTGATTVNAGTLQAAAVSGSAMGETVSVTVNAAGTLLLGASNQINDEAGVMLAGGMLRFGAVVSEGTSSSRGAGALTLMANSTLDFSGFAGTITFTSFNPGAYTLSVQNWTPDAHLLFTDDQSFHLSSFSFGGESAFQVSFGSAFNIVPVPEPGTAAAAVLLLGMTLCSSRRRVRRGGAFPHAAAMQERLPATAKDLA